MQNCVSLRSPIFDFGSRGPSKFEKHPIFDVFEGFSPITLVFLTRFTSKRAQNACINELNVNSRPIILQGCQGAVKIEKHPFQIYSNELLMFVLRSVQQTDRFLRVMIIIIKKLVLSKCINALASASDLKTTPPTDKEPPQLIGKDAVRRTLASVLYITIYI